MPLLWYVLVPCPIWSRFSGGIISASSLVPGSSLDKLLNCCMTKMACKAPANSPPNDCVAADDPQTARYLLRSQRCELIDRLTCETVRALADKLYQQRIMSHNEMENIQSEKTRREMARSLVSVVETRSRAHCVQFARLLMQTEGIEDVGRNVLESAGVLNGQPLDCQSLVKENSQLKDKLMSEKQKSKRKTQKVRIEKQKVKIQQQKTGECKLMETAMRCRLAHMESINYEDTQTGSWKALPHLTQNLMCTVNCVTAVGKRIVAGYNGGSDVYTLSNGSEQWESHKSLHGAISNVFSYQDTCYVATECPNKIYMWMVGSDTWHHVTDIPGRQGGFSLTASDEHIYMLGGWYCKPLNSAAVYDIKAEKWQSLPDMPFTSCECSSAIINNTLYVGGGCTRDSSGVHPVSEVSSIVVNDTQWRRHPPLRYGRATITSTGRSLISSGGESLDGHAVNTVDVFDVISGQWLPLPPMVTPRYVHGVCVTETNSLVAVGGYENTSCEIAHFV